MPDEGEMRDVASCEEWLKGADMLRWVKECASRNDGYRVYRGWEGGEVLVGNDRGALGSLEERCQGRCGEALREGQYGIAEARERDETS